MLLRHKGQRCSGNVGRSGISALLAESLVLQFEYS